MEEAMREGEVSGRVGGGFVCAVGMGHGGGRRGDCPGWEQQIGHESNCEAPPERFGGVQHGGIRREELGVETGVWSQPGLNLSTPAGLQTPLRWALWSGNGCRSKARNAAHPLGRTRGILRKPLSSGKASLAFRRAARIPRQIRNNQQPRKNRNNFVAPGIFLRENRAADRL